MKVAMLQDIPWVRNFEPWKKKKNQMVHLNMVKWRSINAAEDFWSVSFSFKHGDVCF